MGSARGAVCNGGWTDAVTGERAVNFRENWLWARRGSINIKAAHTGARTLSSQASVALRQASLSQASLALQGCQVFGSGGSSRLKRMHKQSGVAPSARAAPSAAATPQGAKGGLPVGQSACWLRGLSNTRGVTDRERTPAKRGRREGIVCDGPERPGARPAAWCVECTGCHVSGTGAGTAGIEGPERASHLSTPTRALPALCSVLQQRVQPQPHAAARQLLPLSRRGRLAGSLGGLLLLQALGCVQRSHAGQQQ